MAEPTSYLIQTTISARSLYSIQAQQWLIDGPDSQLATHVANPQESFRSFDQPLTAQEHPVLSEYIALPHGLA